MFLAISTHVPCKVCMFLGRKMQDGRKMEECNCKFLEESNCKFLPRPHSMQTPPRKSSRSSKGKPPAPFDWTSDGMAWTVHSKHVILPRQIGGTREHVTPRAQIKRSGISHAGNGFFVSERILGAGHILAEYKGEIISIYDAVILQMQVGCCVSMNLCRVFCDYLISCLIKGKGCSRQAYRRFHLVL